MNSSRSLRIPPPLVGLTLVIVLLLPLVSLGYVTRENVLGALAQRGEEERTNTATVTARIVAETARSAESDLVSFSGRILLRAALRSGDATELLHQMRDLKGANPRYNSAAAFDIRGVMLQREPDGGIVGQSFADREYFKNSLVTPDPYVSEIYLSRAASLPVIAIALRVSDGSVTLGVINVTIDSQQFIEQARGLRAIDGRELLLVDGSSRVIASSGSHEVFSHVDLPRAAGPVSGNITVAGAPYLAAYVPVANSSWMLYVLDDPEIALRVEHDLERTMTIAFGIAALFIVLLGVVAAYATAARSRAARQVSLAYETMREANEQLLEVDREKDEFVSTVSHEFRTPLTGILGFSEMIRNEADLTVDEMREFAGDIHRDAQRLARMINDMLDLDRMRSGAMGLERRPVDLNGVVEDVVVLARPNAPGHRIETELDRDLPAIEADRDRLVQVVTNLVSNAVKYSPQGGTVRLRTWLEGDTVRLSVSDEGIGIPADQLGKVFERFTRVESKAMRDIQGTGLGLPIVQQIVELHGGRVWVESVLGSGSTFHVTLPVVPGASSATRSAVGSEA